jgi:hypothetical protein
MDRIEHQEIIEVEPDLPLLRDALEKPKEGFIANLAAQRDDAPSPAVALAGLSGARVLAEARAVHVGRRDAVVVLVEHVERIRADLELPVAE